MITDDFIEDLYDTSPLHDIGKEAIRDAILLKEGILGHKQSLTHEEVVGLIIAERGEHFDPDIVLDQKHEL